MGDTSFMVLAAGQGGEGGKGTSNFLVPNGTFFFVLAIFLIVLAIIGTFVVPPVLKVMRERDAMVAKTAADSKKAAEQFAAAQADYDEALTEARGRASALRDDARAEGRKVVDGARAQAEQDVDVVLRAAAERLKLERDAVELDLRGNVPAMAATLAGRILGVEVAPAPATGTAGR
jgi:F-type H+-transporting ATPase subunit b